MDEEKEELKTKLQKLLRAVREGIMEDVEDVINWFDQDLARNKQLLADLYALRSKCPTQHDVIINACRHNQPDILYYLLEKTCFLDYLIDPSVSETEVHNHRKNAIQHALNSNAFYLIEMLYDYWCGDLYWTGHDIQKLEALEKLLEDSRVVGIEKKQSLMINYHCLVMFNRFQLKVYRRLPKEKPSDMSPEELATALVCVLNNYHKYSELGKKRLPRYSRKEELELRKCFEDRSCIFYKGLANVQYDVYFRKMDFNVSLLILENLYLIRGHLKRRFNRTEKYFATRSKLKTTYRKEANLYKQIESAIYHFVYRTYEDWRLYLPKERLITIEKNHVGYHEGQIIENLELEYDLHKLNNAPVIYLERNSFKHFFKKLNRILKKHILRADPAPSEEKDSSKKYCPVIFLDDNYLKSIMYMKNYYSLRRIVDYIEAIESTNGLNVLMIERVLQVIGEMTKNTNECYHISESTKALIQVALSVETIDQIRNIREFVSHAHRGQLTTRIEMEEEEEKSRISADQHKQTFHNIVRDLKEIKEIFMSVLKMYKYVLDKSLLEKGLRLLNKRIGEWPDLASRNLPNIKDGLVLETSDFVQRVWKPAKLPIQLLKEIPLVLNNRDQISLKVQKTKILMEENLVNILSSNIQSIERTLELIDKNTKNVSLVNIQLSKHDFQKLPLYPNMEEINQCQNKTKRKRRGNQQVNVDLKGLDDLKDYSVHWKSMKIMLKFCLDDCELFASIRKLLSLRCLNESSVPDDVNLTEARKIIEEMEAVYLMHTSTLAWLAGRRLTLWGLCNYKSYINKPAFKSGNPSFSGIEAMNNIVSNHKMPPLKSNEDWKTAQKKLIFCLIKRVKLLQHLLQYPQMPPDDQLIRKYKQDKKFRIELEMILADIFNVLVQCNKTIRIMKKTTQLLRGIDLGNVLDHGNPMLEVLAGVFDSYELPKAYLSKAKELADDREAIEALYELFQSDVDHSTLKSGDLSKMNHTQKTYYAELKKSHNWTSYAQILFVPKKYR